MPTYFNRKPVQYSIATTWVTGSEIDVNLKQSHFERPIAYLST